MDNGEGLSVLVLCALLTLRIRRTLAGEIWYEYEFAHLVTAGEGAPPFARGVLKEKESPEKERSAFLIQAYIS